MITNRTRPTVSTNGKRLEQLLKDNKSKLSVNSNGFVSVNMNSNEAIEAIQKEIKTFRNIRLNFTAYNR